MTTDHSSTTAADALVERLVALGTQIVFALPGEENLMVMDALRRSDVEVVITRHEQHAAFMAATWGRLTGTVGVCLATLGPGALNLLTGLAHAQLGGYPVLALTGQKAQRDNDEGSFQIIDVVAAADPVTKWAITIDDPSEAPAIVDRAHRTALAGRPGAVLIELPEDVAALPFDSTIPPAPSPQRLPNPAPESLLEATRLIDNGDRVVLLAGGGTNDPRISADLEAFSHTTGIGVVTTQLGKGAIATGHPHSLGAIGMHRADYVHHAIDAADVVLTVGYDPVEHPPLAWNRVPGRKVVHVAPWPARPEPGYQPVLDLVGDPGFVLGELARELSGRDAELVKAQAAAIKELLAEEQPTSKADTLSPLQVVRSIRTTLGEDDVVALDNGVYKLWFARHYTADKAGTLLLDNALATMGAGLAMASAAALLHPDCTTVAVCGDGGLMMNVQDLETAVRHKLNLVVLVLRDDAYGFIEWHQEEQGLEPFGVELSNPDLVALAGAFGAEGRHVEGVDDLERELTAAARRGGVTLIDCPIDYSDNEILERDLYGSARSRVPT